MSPTEGGRVARAEAALGRLGARLGEAPWLLLLFAVAVRALQVPPSGVPSGSDWHQYLLATLSMSDPEGGWVYPDWRSPLYPWLIHATRGQHSYTVSAQWISHVSIIGMIAGTGLTARALGGRGAALVAVGIAATSPLLASFTEVVTPYAMLGALAGLAFGFGALAVRTGSLAAAALGAGCGTAAMITDVKGVPAALAAAALVLLAGVRLPVRRAIGVVLAGAIAGAAPIRLDAWLQEHYRVTVLPVEKQIEIQRSLFSEQLRLGTMPDPAVNTSCATAPDKLDVAALRGACSRALYRYNAKTLRRSSAYPAIPTQVLAAFALLPALVGFGRPGWPSALRSMAASAITMGAAIGSVALGMAWIWYWDRYALPSAPAALALLPVAAARAGGLVRVAPRLATTLLLASLAVATAVGAQRTFGEPPQHADGPVAMQPPEATIPWLESRIAPDDLIYDCAKLSADVALAPRRLHYLTMRPDRWDCVRPPPKPAAPAAAWFIQRVDGHGPRGMSADPSALVARGWKRMDGPSQDLEVWHLPADSSASPATPDARYGGTDVPAPDPASRLLPP